MALYAMHDIYGARTVLNIRVMKQCGGPKKYDKACALSVIPIFPEIKEVAVGGER